MATIVVDGDLCTRCGICAHVCANGLIDPPRAGGVPVVPDEKESWCIRCGHCETHCPTGALTLQYRTEDKVPRPGAQGVLAAENLAAYMKLRRSVRNFTSEPVAPETFLSILDVARYAASGGNGQQVGWLVIRDAAEVRRLAALVIDWMRTLVGSEHPMAGYIPALVEAWDRGEDPICRNAPHLVVAHIPAGNPVAAVDALIALTYFDVAAPAFGVGACWAGFLSMAAKSYDPLRAALVLPEGRAYGYALFCGTPKFASPGIPRRNPPAVSWR